MSSQKHYDVIIIGTGAGGGTLAKQLAPSGKSILILERGDYVPREKENWDPRLVNVEGRYQTKEHWRDKALVSWCWCLFALLAHYRRSSDTAV